MITIKREAYDKKRERVAGAIALGIRDNEHPRLIADTVLELIAAAPTEVEADQFIAAGCASCEWKTDGPGSMARLNAHLDQEHPRPFGSERPR